MAKASTKKQVRTGTGSNAASRKLATQTPPAGIIAGSDNPDVLVGFLTQPSLYLTVGATKILRNPDPIVQMTTNRLGTHVYDEMLDKDCHVAGLVDTRINATVGLPREVQPGNDGELAVRIADVIKTIFDRWHSFESDMQTLMLALVHGYRPAEIEYTLWEDGLWGIKKLHDRDPESFSFDVEHKLRLRTVKEPYGGQELDPRAFVCLVHQPRANNPYGVGIGRGLWWITWIKRNGLKSWLVAVEKFGVPTIHFAHEAGLNATKRQAMIDAGNKVMTDTVLLTSKDVDVQLLESRGGISGHDPLLEYLDDQSAVRVLGQALTTNAKDTGLNSSQPSQGGKVRQDLLERDALWVGGFVTGTIFRYLVDFNFGPQKEEDYPFLLVNASPPEDTKALADRDVILVKDLALPVARAYFYEKYSIPKPEPEDDLINDDIADAAQAAMPLGLDPMGGIDPATGKPLPPDAQQPPKKKAKPKEDDEKK